MRLSSRLIQFTLFDIYRLAGRPRGGKAFRFSMLHDFLMELDGPKHEGRSVGHLDWRYYFIQDPRGRRLP